MLATIDKNLCVRLRGEEFAHLQACASACGDTPTGLLRRLVRATRVVRVAQPARIALAADDAPATALDQAEEKP